MTSQYNNKLNLKTNDPVLYRPTTSDFDESSQSYIYDFVKNINIIVLFFQWYKIQPQKSMHCSHEIY